METAAHSGKVGLCLGPGPGSEQPRRHGTQDWRVLRARGLQTSYIRPWDCAAVHFILLIPFIAVCFYYDIPHTFLLCHVKNFHYLAVSLLLLTAIFSASLNEILFWVST